MTSPRVILAHPKPQHTCGSGWCDDGSPRQATIRPRLGESFSWRLAEPTRASVSRARVYAAIDISRSRTATSKNVSDQALVRKVIAEGSAAVGRSPLSPPWGRSLTRQQIDYLVAYCQALGRKKS